MPPPLLPPPMRPVWLHDTAHSRRIIDPMRVYWIEADSGDTLLHLGPRARVRDIRPLSVVIDAFIARGFLRIHRSHAINPHRVARYHSTRRDPLLQLEPPLNTRLPIGRTYVQSIRDYFS
jgi:DNA-binding LytR/AlgR family response regulator